MSTQLEILPPRRAIARRPLVALAREHTVDAINTLAILLNDSDSRIRLDAAEAILNRGWGKAPITMSVTAMDAHGDGTPLSLDEKIEMLTKALMPGTEGIPNNSAAASPDPDNPPPMEKSADEVRRQQAIEKARERQLKVEQVRAQREATAAALLE